jgi:hypothetical protein
MQVEKTSVGKLICANGGSREIAELTFPGPKILMFLVKLCYRLMTQRMQFLTIMIQMPFFILMTQKFHLLSLLICIVFSNI